MLRFGLVLWQFVAAHSLCIEGDSDERNQEVGTPLEAETPRLTESLLMQSLPWKQRPTNLPGDLSGHE